MADDNINPMQSGASPDRSPTNRGRLKNGAAGGDPSTAPRCGAHTRAGRPCFSPAMANGRCRMHGGRSTGPRTEEGLARMGHAHVRHGAYTAASKTFDHNVADLLSDDWVPRALAALTRGRTRINPMQSGKTPRRPGVAAGCAAPAGHKRGHALMAGPSLRPCD